MIVSAKGRYALYVMIKLAHKPQGEFISLKDVAEEEAFPHKYLESIMTTLAKAGLVEGSRGKNGGYRLVREPKDYTVAEILRLTETSLASVSCLESHDNPCEKSCSCPTLPMWKALDDTIDEFLKKYTLADFVK